MSSSELAQVPGVPDQERQWREFSRVQKAAILIDLAVTLRRHLLRTEMAASNSRALAQFARSALVAGNWMLRDERFPFVPDPLFRWAELSPQQGTWRVSEVTEWAVWEFFRGTLPDRMGHTLLMLHFAGRKLEGLGDFLRPLVEEGGTLK